MISGRHLATVSHIWVTAGIYGAMASTISTMAFAMTFATSLKFSATTSMMGLQASTILTMPSAISGNAATIAPTILFMPSVNAVMICGILDVIPDNMVLMISPPVLMISGNLPMIPETKLLTADAAAVISCGALATSPSASF